MCDFLGSSGDEPQIVFSTYQSAHIVGEAVQGMQPFDLGVFDEAHKTAGREGAKFGFALVDRNLPIRKRVFMTATPRHYDVRKRDKEGDKALVYSMDQPAIYGPMVHTLSFVEAARRGIICNYKVIISVVTSSLMAAGPLSSRRRAGCSSSSSALTCFGPRLPIGITPPLRVDPLRSQRA